MRAGWLRLWRVATMALLALAATACTATMVPAYDEQIDNGLTTLYGDTSVFVDNMIARAGTPEGSYADNGGFYDAALGTMASLIARAEAHRAMDHCPSTKFLAKVLARAELPVEVAGQIGALPQDDCQVVLLRLIRDGFADMRELHRLRGERGFPPEARAQLVEAGVGAQLRAAMTVEIAKRGR